MPINSIENAVRYTGELEKLFVQRSATGFFTDNAMRSKFVGAKTVLIPEVDFKGLADYDRDTGFTRGPVTVSNTSYTMSMDRGRSMQIDREDLDESGVANLAGQILGEYVRTKVVPECDAYVISKLAGLAATRGNTVNGEITKPLAALNELVQEVRNNVGYDEELVAFISGGVYAALTNSNEISRMITVSDFKQGEINLKMKSFDGVTLIPVVPERMYTAYTFLADGGFKPLDNARSTYMLVCPKKAAHLVKKTEQMRIFTPEQNIDADAYKFDYRIYYDVFVTRSKLDSIWTWISPAVTVGTQPADAEGAGSTLTVAATADNGGEISYQWYTASDADGNGASKIAGATAGSYKVPSDLEEGIYYYFARIKVDGIIATDSKVATVTIV